MEPVFLNFNMYVNVGMLKPAWGRCVDKKTVLYKEKAKFIEWGNHEFRVGVLVNGGAVHGRVTVYLCPHCIHQAFTRNHALPVPSPGFVSEEVFGFLFFTPHAPTHSIGQGVKTACCVGFLRVTA